MADFGDIWKDPKKLIAVDVPVLDEAGLYEATEVESALAEAMIAVNPDAAVRDRAIANTAALIPHETRVGTLEYLASQLPTRLTIDDMPDH